MKSKRRHELQENVLAQEIGKIAEFLRKYGNHLATAVLVIAIVVFVTLFITRRTRGKQVQLQQQWQRALSGDLKPEERTRDLTALAEQTSNSRIAALAGVELAYQYTSQLLAARDSSQRTALSDKAAQWFRITIEKYPDQALAVAKAHFGLGNLREGAGQFEQAAEEYRLAKASPELTGQPVVQLAERALQQLKALQSAKVRMASTMPATAPATRPEGVEATTKPAAAPAPAPTTQPAGKPAGKPAK